jgi:hypothetical protein
MMLTFCLITPGDLAILLAGTGTTPVTRPGQVARHGYCDEAKVGRLNPAADMFVLLSWEQSTQLSRHPRGTAI